MSAIVKNLNNAFGIIQSTVPEVRSIMQFVYGSVSQANVYFDNRLNSYEWKKATIEDKNAALIGATQLINRLNYAGNATGLQAFPRDITDGEIPYNVVVACYEIAFKLIQGFDPDFEIDNLGAVSQGYSTVRSSYDRTIMMDHLRAGIPSSRAWEYLKPYLADISQVRLTRIS